MAILMLHVAADGPAKDLAQSSLPAEGDPEIVTALVTICRQHSLPALAGAIVTSEGLLRNGVAGVRKYGSPIGCKSNDRWHLGSDTKAMTAALAARLVEQKLLRWDSTVSEVFPKLADSFHKECKQLTLVQLLTHQAGLPANLVWRKYGKSGKSVQDQRLQVVEDALKEAPQHPPGIKYLYSNLGYVIAGSMIECVTKKSWEQAIQDEIFAPLRMANTGQGGQGTLGAVDQPWGHTKSGEPVKKNGPEMDNPPIIGPAGRVHSTLSDWSRFVADFMAGLQGKEGILKLESYKALTTPPKDADYALGWAVLQREWGGGTVYHHAGCNTMNYANLWVAPQRNFAVLICCNQGDEIAAKATDQAASALITLHLSKKNAR